MTRRARLVITTGAAAVAGALGTTVTLSARTGEAPLPPPKAAAATPDRPSPSPQPPPDSRPQLVLPEAGGAPAPAENVTTPDEETAEEAPTQDASDPGEPPPGDPTLGGHDALRRATVLENGIALPPLEAPAEVAAIIEAGNIIARSPYKWGGGHGRWQYNGYDCSGSVS